MKKLFTLSILIFFLTIVSRGQITKGNWLLGGSLSYSKSNSKGLDVTNSKIRQIDITSGIGNFILDKFSVGIAFNTFFSKARYPQALGGEQAITQNLIGMGPFIRYYFLQSNNRINVFSDASIIYSFLNNNTTNGNEKSWASSISAGTVIFLNTSVGLEFLLGYRHGEVFKFDAVSNFLQFKVGLQFYLEKE